MRLVEWYGRLFYYLPIISVSFNAEFLPVEEYRTSVWLKLFDLFDR